MSNLKAGLELTLLGLTEQQVVELVEELVQNVCIMGKHSGGDQKFRVV